MVSEYLEKDLEKLATDITIWRFGKPTLEAGGAGKASWTTAKHSDDHTVAWAARLDAGVQTSWDDYAKVVVPVNELPFTKLNSVRLSPYYTADTGIDMGVCVYIHNPNDFDQRIEISHTPLTTSAAGWRELNWPTDVPTGHAFFWYGEEALISGNTICTTEDTAYTWAQFQADPEFSTWTIYKITFDYGYYTGGGTMDGCYLAQAQINDITIPLEPYSSKYYTTVNVQKTLEADGIYTAKDVMSESDTGGEGTPWVFEFGGVGKIITAVAVCGLTTATSVLNLFLYDALPTCELDDNAGNNGPLVADMPHYLGHIAFPALASLGGPSYTIAEPVGEKLPIAFSKTRIYGVLVDVTGEDYVDDETMDIVLTAELDA